MYTQKEEDDEIYLLLKYLAGVFTLYLHRNSISFIPSGITVTNDAMKNKDEKQPLSNERGKNAIPLKQQFIYNFVAKYHTSMKYIFTHLLSTRRKTNNNK